MAQGSGGRRVRTAPGGVRNIRPAYIVAAGLILAVIAGFIVVLVISQGQDGAVSGPEETEFYEVASREHVPGEVEYEQDPPVGGPHNAAWQNCGYYPEPVPSQHAVHSLEHGAVWVTYQEGLPEDQVSTLQDLANSQTFVLVSPYPDLSAPVVASAWGYQLQLDSADDPRLDEFIQSYRLGPQTPEPGAPCTNGVGQPGA